MPAQINSYQLYLNAKQVGPPCPVVGPTGNQGPIGPTGPTGPIGLPGINGVSVGQNYFFNLAGDIITSSTGITGGTLNTNSINAGANTSYTGGYYDGYFIQRSATGTNIPVGRFTSTAGLQSPIPAGVWTFYNNIYSFTGPTGPQPWAIPTGPGTDNDVYAVLSYIDGPTGGQIFQTASKNINLSDDLVILNGYIPTPITLNNPTGAYFYVDYFATNPTGGNVIELWTQGNSVAYVTTTFSPIQGSTGSTGPAGPTGPQGPAGFTPGSANRLAWFPTNNNVSSTPGITTNGSNLTVSGSLVAPGTNTLGSTTLAAFTSTGNSSLTGGASLSVDGSITCNGNITGLDIIATSDKRVKDNIITIESALEKVSKLRGVYFERKNEIGTRRIGLIAQEVEEVLPEVVYTDSDGLKSVSYGSITGLLIEAIKEQQEIILRLK